MNSVIVGYGEIGKAVYEFINEPTFVVDLKFNQQMTDGLIGFDIMHVCFPPSETFVEDVKNYINEFSPQHVIVWSSVPIGTCSQIGDFVAHSPVEGKHPELVRSIKLMTRWVGCANKAERGWFAAYFSNKNISVHEVEQAEFTEALKLLSTTEYGLNIEFARYKKRVADEIAMDYELTKEWNRDYNKLYRSLDMPQFQKFVLDAPEGPKGGHCILPNARILNQQFPDGLVEIVGELTV